MWCAMSRWCRRLHLPQAVGYNRRTAQRRSATFTNANVGPDDIAVLQYTGGTTGVAKGAVLLHRNVIANIQQAEAWFSPMLKDLLARW